MLLLTLSSVQWEILIQKYTLVKYTLNEFDDWNMNRVGDWECSGRTNKAGPGQRGQLGGTESQDWAQVKAKVSIPRRAPCARSLEAFLKFLEAAQNFLLGSVLASKGFWLKGTLRISWIILSLENTSSAYELTGFEDWRLVEEFVSLEGLPWWNTSEWFSFWNLRWKRELYFIGTFFSGFGRLEPDSWLTLDRIYFHGLRPCTWHLWCYLWMLYFLKICCKFLE